MTDITTTTIYFTSLCNSGCKTCDIWKETKRVEFPFEEFQRMIRLPMLDKSSFALIGGEFTTYSRYIDVIEELNNLGKKYYFISNGILPNKIKKVYERTGIQTLSLSLDSYGLKHDELRGAPHNFKKIEEIIQWVKVNHPETNLRVCYTISNLNSRADMIKVIEFAKNYELDVKFGIASNSELFLARSEEVEVKFDELYKFEDLVNQHDEYLQLYRAWQRGLHIECKGILEHLVMMYDGNVMLCENKSVVLGNFLEQPLEELWASDKVRAKLEEYAKSCNECWMSCMRKTDAKLFDKTSIDYIQQAFGYVNKN